ncbi:MAG TPA: polyprenyl synthetase family protein [Phycisphaerae bacterium]|nr:polyprenyl synthetase family protein [Phycisphaerae bacterium]
METSLSTLLNDFYSPVADELARVERRFDEELVSELPMVDDLCGRVRLYRGKMLRPTLLLLTAKACGSIRDEHITLAAVLEIVHVATLVHDDVLDEADVRRKRATINAGDGNETAVLLGDYLISHAFHLCSGLNDQFASRLIGSTTNTVCEGELMQIHHRADAGLSESLYLDIIRRKTAALTGACCELGARYAGASPGEAEAWRQFGLNVGVAFQIVDDVLDYTGTQQKVGKTLGRDLELGEPTLPTIHAMRHAAPAVRAELALALGNGHTVSRERICGWLEETGSVEYAYGRAAEFITTAQTHLEGVRPSPARDALWAVTEFVLRRQH